MHPSVLLVAQARSLAQDAVDAVDVVTKRAGGAGSVVTLGS